MQLKAELESLIADQHPSIRIVAADKSTKSEVWDNDCYLMVFRDNIKQEFALCSMCRNLITYKSCYGTGSLIRHSCFRKRKRDNMKRKLDEAAMPTVAGESQADECKYPRIKATSSTPTSLSTDCAAIMSPPQSTSLPGGGPHLRMNNSKHLEMLIKNKDPSVELVDRTRDEWIYKDIYNYGRRQDFVFCMVCHKTVSKYSYIQRTHQCFVDFMTGGGGGSAGNIANHAAYAEAVKTGLVPNMANNNNAAVSPTNSDTTATSSSSTASVYFTMEDKQELVQQQLYFMYHDLVPAKMIDGKGFQRLAQCLINIGASYGKVPVKNVLIDSETMYNQQALICQTIRHNIKAIFDKYKMVFGCDMWSDIVRQKQCLTLTAHYIDDNFELKKIVLGTKTIKEPSVNGMPTDGDAVLQKVYEILANYTDGADKLLSRSVIVSGDTTALANGLRAHTRISCACWALNNIVKSVLASVQLEIERISNEIKTILSTIKETKCGHKIAPLYSEQLSGWDSIWQLFAIVSDPDVQEVIEKMGIPMPGYEPYAKILQPFRLASLALSSETRPTLNAVYMFRKKLEDSLSLSYFDEPEHIKTLKMNGLKMLQEQFTISPLHKMALFLDPRFKSLKFFSNDERTEVIDMVKRMSANCTIKTVPMVVVASQPLDSGLTPKLEINTRSNDGENESEGVRVKCEDGQSEYLIEYMDDHTSDTESHSELNMYMSLKSDVTHSGDILKFWESRVDMPHLRQLAKEVLCIPASATAAEQLFSDDAKLLAKRRLFMEPDELDRTLLIHGTSPKLSM